MRSGRGESMLFPWTLVVAMDVRGTIAKDGRLPWHLPSELKHFKRLTFDHPVIMGRKTFEAIGRVLPGRRNVILSRQKQEKMHQEQVSDQMTSIDHIHDLNVLFERYGQQPAMVIGGREIFALLLPYCTRMVQTIVLAEVEGDTFFPCWDHSDWVLIERSAYRHKPDEPYAYIIQTFQRKQK
ncbi:MAG: dihydrofolate reductase [Candidatus Carbobacillus sp.]|nr:dihydrofolate reductase [Candidatus Carbobacillus sp.]